jgi:hypothetical protein
MTIVEAIEKALLDIGRPANYEEIHTKIIERGYYKFKAVQPLSIVRVQLRKHCVNVVIPSAANSTKFFRSEGGKGKNELFSLLGTPSSPSQTRAERVAIQLSTVASTTSDNEGAVRRFINQLKVLFSRVKKSNFSFETHKITAIECFWMLIGSFLPIFLDSVLRVIALKIGFSSAIGENIKGGEVFLLTSALITPFYFSLIKYVSLNADDKKESKLPYFGFVLFFSIVAFVSGLFAFIYYRIGRIIVDSSGSDFIKGMFQFEFGYWAWGIYIVSFLIWYYSSYMNNRTSDRYKNIRAKQLDELSDKFAQGAE